jgi:hypothetical protein
MFRVDPREDEETNPFCYGREFASWLKGRFENLGYERVEVVPEDWGWYVSLRTEPFRLGVACGNVIDPKLYETISPEAKKDFVPDEAQMTWTCWACAESSFWRSLLGRVSADSARSALGELTSQLHSILSGERRIRLISEADA